MNDKWKNIVIVVVALATILMVGYSTFAQSLAVKTATQTSASGVWNIGFTNAVRSSMSGTASELAPVDFTSTTATFFVYLGSPGDQISYDFTVKNSGSLNAKVDSIYMFPANEADDAILFTVSGIQAGDDLEVGDSKVVKVTAMYNPHYRGDATGLQKSVTVVINYKQK